MLAMLNKSIYILLISITIMQCQQQQHHHRTHTARRKRNLVYTPRNNIVQLIIGTGVPVPLENGQALTIGWVLKATYNTPNNASYYTNPYVQLQKRSTDIQRATRFDLYRSFEASFQRFGGKACVLRTICEAARTPFHASSIVGQLLHIIFTPSTTDEPALVPTDRLYESAHRFGSTEDVSCTALFPECKKSFLDLLTVTQ